MLAENISSFPYLGAVQCLFAEDDTDEFELKENLAYDDEIYS